MRPSAKQYVWIGYKMDITIDIKKQYAFVIILISILFLGIIIVHAVTPNPGHEATQILVTTAQGEEMILQDAINQDLRNNFFPLYERDIISSVPYDFLPWKPGCFKEADKAYSGPKWQLNQRIEVNPQPHQICFLSFFGPDPADSANRGYANVIKNVNDEWVVTAYNSMFQLNCLDSTVDYPNVRDFNCIHTVLGTGP